MTTRASDGTTPATDRTSPAPPSRLALGGIRLWTRTHAWLYRRSRGKFLGIMPGPNKARNPVLLLETVGRTSGKTRTTPLIFLADGRDFVVVASGRGPDGTTDWLRNVEATPLARVRLGDETIPVRAERATPDERARLWPHLVAMFARWGEMQKVSASEIPVLVLRPVAADGSAPG